MRVCRRSARMAAEAVNPWVGLPHGLAVAVFSRLLVRERLRCREVSRAWRTWLDDPALWRRLDLRPEDGTACAPLLLVAAAARAGRQLEALRLTCGGPWDPPSIALHAAVCAVLAGNRNSLQELRLDQPATLPGGLAAPLHRRPGLEALLRAAPQLRLLEADVACADAEEARLMLRNEAPLFVPLRVGRLQVHCDGLDADAVVAVAADVADSASLPSLELCSAPLHSAAALDAVVDASLARPLSSLALLECRCSRALLPAVVRLLGGNALTHLALDVLPDDAGAQPLLDVPTAALLGAALRANTSLTSLSMKTLGLWRVPTAAVGLLDALTGHPRLRKLDVSWTELITDHLLHQRPVGAALGELVMADAPALRELCIERNDLGDAGMGFVFDALAHNTHLRTLKCRSNQVSEELLRDQLLPAVLANSGLRNLDAGDLPSAQQARALVSARPPV